MQSEDHGPSLTCSKSKCWPNQCRKVHESSTVGCFQRKCLPHTRNLDGYLDGGPDHRCLAHHSCWARISSCACAASRSFCLGLGFASSTCSLQWSPSYSSERSSRKGTFAASWEQLWHRPLRSPLSLPRLRTAGSSAAMIPFGVIINHLLIVIEY